MARWHFLDILVKSPAEGLSGVKDSTEVCCRIESGRLRPKAPDFQPLHSVGLSLPLKHCELYTPIGDL